MIHRQTARHGGETPAPEQKFRIILNNLDDHPRKAKTVAVQG
jgi:hypothetical protein